MMIEYREFNSELIEEIVRVYKDNGWEEYLTDRSKLISAFDNSLFTLGAFDDGKLVGFVRCVGDAEYIIYVQDLIVKSTHHRKGIGSELIKRASNKYPTVRQFVLITDKDDKVSNSFYRAMGLTENCNGYPINHYFRSV